MKGILKQHNIHPSRLSGQNFLTNKGIVKKIVKSADLTRKDSVLEIGPGLGILTEELIKNAGRVIAIEKDKKIYELLREKFKDAKNLELINADILTHKVKSANYKLIANIPYNITGKIFRKFFSEKSSPQTMVIMVQREVGEKLLGKSRSMLTLSRELYGNAKKVCDVAPGSFFPKPKVTSTVIKLTIGYPTSDSKGVLRIARAGFMNRRKKLISNLSTVLKVDKDKLKKKFKLLKWSETIRAEELSKDDWLKLAEIIYKN